MAKMFALRLNFVDKVLTGLFLSIIIMHVGSLQEQAERVIILYRPDNLMWIMPRQGCVYLYWRRACHIGMPAFCCSE